MTYSIYARKKSERAVVIWEGNEWGIEKALIDLDIKKSDKGKRCIFSNKTHNEIWIVTQREGAIGFLYI